MRRALAILAFVAACDPVHDHAVDALGDEAPGVRKGPLHRPGQPCLLCHDGALGDPPEFTLAGTVYLDDRGGAPADGAKVAFKDHEGTTFVATTNAAGNFYIAPQEFVPAYPLEVALTNQTVKGLKMTSLIGREGSCAGCHTSSPGPSSPGPVTIIEDGGTP